MILQTERSGVDTLCRMESGCPGWKRAAAQLMDALLPRYCLLCGLNSGNSPLCIHCTRDLPRTDAACPRCALPVPTAARCGRCLRHPPPWNHATAALLYRFPTDALVQRFKFRRDLCCGAVLAGELLTTLRQSPQPLPDALVPVPLHRRRWLSRTFNQAELLALHLGRSLQLPVHGRLLQRRRGTRGVPCPADWRW